MSIRREFVVPPIDLDEASNIPLQRQISRQIAASIRNCDLQGGARLPSTRLMARLLHVSRNTVLAAYDDLVADDLIRGKRGAGMWVNGGPPPAWAGLRHVIRTSGYPTRTLTLADPDGNPLYIRV